jgi:hypothetical protein
MDDESLRVSDADRERAVVSLRQHLPAGRLTPDEFAERVEAALQARVGADLAGVQQDEWGRDTGRADAPTVRIRVFSIFGTVDVWPVPHGMQGGYGDIFRQLHERQRQLPG